MSDGSPLKRFWAGWKRFGEKAAVVFGLVLFAVLYALLFVPVAAVCRLLGMKFLPVFGASPETYYLPAEKSEPTVEFMKRQG